MGDAYEGYFMRLSNMAKAEVQTPGQERLGKFLDSLIGVKEPAKAYEMAARTPEQAAVFGKDVGMAIRGAAKEPLMEKALKVKPEPRPEFAARERHKQFLESVAKVDEEAKVISNASKSAGYTARLKGMLRGDRKAIGELGNRIHKQLLDDATANGGFGDAGAIFDPQKYAAAYRNARPSLARLRSWEAMEELDLFAQAMGTLQLQKAGGITGKFHTLAAPSVVVGGLTTLAYAIKAGNPIAGLGAIMGEMAYFSPKIFMNLVLKPGGPKLLTEAIYGNTATAKSAKLLAASIQAVMRGRDHEPPPDAFGATGIK